MPDKDERSLEQVYRSAVSGLYARLRNNYDFLYRKYGNEGLVLICRYESRIRPHDRGKG